MTVKKKITKKQAARVFDKLTDEQRDELIQRVLARAMRTFRDEINFLQDVTEIQVSFKVPMVIDDGRTIFMELNKEVSAIKEA